MKALIDKPLDRLELGHIRLAMAKGKCPHKLDISVLYQLTKRLPHKDGVAPQHDPGPTRLAYLNYDDERLLIHFYDTFYDESIVIRMHC